MRLFWQRRWQRVPHSWWQANLNAPHDAWGYTRPSAKGVNLLQAVMDYSLQLLTDPHYPTCTGSSVQRDTTPDLAFIKNTTGAKWQNLQENLGSNHCSNGRSSSAGRAERVDTAFYSATEQQQRVEQSQQCKQVLFLFFKLLYNAMQLLPVFMVCVFLQLLRCIVSCCTAFFFCFFFLFLLL